ncbi:hypothetical protein T484DRAFT_2421698 [Baffinella frigidus]|nr:hypothetical protein T484DRAFT_2421698 [Cryptophyta sp. CCMP2293]
MASSGWSRLVRWRARSPSEHIHRPRSSKPFPACMISHDGRWTTSTAASLGTCSIATCTTPCVSTFNARTRLIAANKISSCERCARAFPLVSPSSFCECTAASRAVHRSAPGSCLRFTRASLLCGSGSAIHLVAQPRHHVGFFSDASLKDPSERSGSDAVLVLSWAPTTSSHPGSNPSMCPWLGRPRPGPRAFNLGAEELVEVAGPLSWWRWRVP